jgi:hypothetical protein
MPWFALIGGQGKSTRIILGAIFGFINVAAVLCVCLSACICPEKDDEGEEWDTDDDDADADSDGSDEESYKKK